LVQAKGLAQAFELVPEQAQALLLATVSELVPAFLQEL